MSWSELLPNKTIIIDVTKIFVGLFTQFSKIKHTMGQDHVNENNEGVEAFPCQVT